LKAAVLLEGHQLGEHELRSVPAGEHTVMEHTGPGVLSVEEAPRRDLLGVAVCCRHLVVGA
jgi:hypothetical protein